MSELRYTPDNLSEQHRYEADPDAAVTDDDLDVADANDPEYIYALPPLRFISEGKRRRFEIAVRDVPGMEARIDCCDKPGFEFGRRAYYFKIPVEALPQASPDLKFGLLFTDPQERFKQRPQIKSRISSDLCSQIGQSFDINRIRIQHQEDVKVVADNFMNICEAVGVLSEQDISELKGNQQFISDIADHYRIRVNQGRDFTATEFFHRPENLVIIRDLALTYADRLNIMRENGLDAGIDAVDSPEIRDGAEKEKISSYSMSGEVYL